MITYLFDASVVVEWYAPQSTFRNISKYTNSCDLRAHIALQKKQGKAVLFMPSFCIAEVRNTLGKWYLRHKVFKSKDYCDCFNALINHVHDRKFFYSYDLNRYHNLNTTFPIKVEHTTNTEFNVSGLLPGTDKKTIEDELKKKDPQDSISKHYLSTFDILIISMGMELKKITGEQVYLMTKDKRLALISNKKSEFPKALYWPDLHVSNLPAAS